MSSVRLRIEIAFEKYFSMTETILEYTFCDVIFGYVKL